MKIQINTDNNIAAGEGFAAQTEARVESSLGHCLECCGALGEVEAFLLWA